jgi:Na+-translocating ferredoxin:NAD+ oxidoreductase subunit G
MLNQNALEQREMASKESTLLNMTLTLLIVTFVASTALGYIYELTKEPIARARLAKKTDAVKKVLPDFDNDPIGEMYKVAADAGYDSLEVYPAVRDGMMVGSAIRSYSKRGFSGDVWVMVGFNADGTIYNVEVLDHKETPGLGTKMSDPKFKNQFMGVDPGRFNLKVDKDGGDVDAITAATISSRAFSDAALRAYHAYKEGGTK